MITSYKNLHSLEKRVLESSKIRAKYPGHIPVIVDLDEKIGKIKKHKFLVPPDVSASHLICSIRNQIKFKKNDAMVLFVDNTILCPTKIMATIYDEYLANKNDDDLFLYVTIKCESVFG